ncbi:MAG: CoA-binding protein [Streptomycetaceae bacterium]|nr:CoA-binding protein [Streptomycetaceae bacterium]
MTTRAAPPPPEHVPEHLVKDELGRSGVAVPRAVAVPVTDAGTDHKELAQLATDLTAPLVLKAWGPGLVHKSDVGAVRLGLRADELPDAARAMTSDLERHGLVPGGWLVEEQHPGGIELIVGVVRDPSFGHVILLGLGGVATEMLDLTALRVLPLTRSDAEALVDGFPGAPLLRGARGKEPVDRAALVRLLLAVGGQGGLVEQYGDRLVEFECNPVVATGTGVMALDARLILDTSEAPDRDGAEPGASTPTDFHRLFTPRAIAVAGASTNRPGFGNRFLAAYRGMGWKHGLYALHPSAREVDGVPAFPDVDRIPDAVDYVVVATPAPTVPALVESCAGKVGFVHVVSGGFAEAGEAGGELQERLRAAVRASGTRLLGPNCLGVYSPEGRQTFTLGSPREPGSVSVISQSGGLSGDILNVGARRGLRFAKLVSIGNAIDVGAAELLDWLADDPETSVIALYLEGVGDGRGLLRALRRAADRKPVVVLTGGTSRQGAQAVASHTGSLAGAPKVWDAVAQATGVVLVPTLEELLGCLAYLQAARSRSDRFEQRGQGGLLVLGPGGGASVLATDAADRAGLALVPLAETPRTLLAARGFGAGTSLANPVEIPIGPAAPPDLLPSTLAAILAEQPFSDVLVHINAAAYYNYGTAGLRPLADTLHLLADQALPTRLAVVVRNGEAADPSDAALISSVATERGLAVFRSLDEAAAAIAAAQRFSELRQGTP